MWLPLNRSGEQERGLELLFRIGVAGCYIGHGAFGVIGKSAWLPYFAVLGIGEEAGWILMPIVGAVDILVGIVALVSPRPVILAYAAVWAVWTALLRPFAGESVFETLERAGNYGIPIALMILAAVRLEWSRGWFRPLRIDRLTSERRTLLMKVLQVTTAMLLLGHGGLALGRKALLVDHLGAVGLPETGVFISGALEVGLAVAVLARPLPGLLLFILAWKVATEALFPITGAPFWEFVERAGSYVAPLALWTLVRRSTPSLVRPGAIPEGASFGSFFALAMAAGLVGAGGLPAVSSTPVSPAAADRALLDELREGGFVLACRHAITDRSRGDARQVDFDDPSTQRVLSREGRRQARRLGEVLGALGVPVGEVLTSPYDRAAETARLAFGRAEVRAALGSRRPQGNRSLRRLFAEVPPAGTNRLLSTHQWVLYPMLPDVEQGSIREGDCVVVRTDDDGSYAAAARMGVEEWSALGRRVAPARPGRSVSGRQDRAGVAITAAVQGGVTLLCRHAKTGTFREVEPVDYEDPSTQRLLSVQGERQSVALGEAMRRHGVRVSELVASPMHRAIRTAELMFDLPVAIDSIWHTNGGSYGGPKAEDRRRALAAPVSPGNRLIVSHVGTITSVIPDVRGRMEEGDCAVIRSANDRFELIGVIPGRAWEEGRDAAG